MRFRSSAAIPVGGGAYHAWLVVFGQSSIEPHGVRYSQEFGAWKLRKAGDRSGIVALAEAIERAWNAGDVKSYAGLYAQEAAYLTRTGVLWTGREAIERGHPAVFRGELKGSVLKIRIRRLRFLTPRTAVAHCAIELNRNGAKQGHKFVPRPDSSCGKSELAGKSSRRKRARFQRAENERLDFADIWLLFFRRVRNADFRETVAEGVA
jgi:uncharacterized protein (TIGR02246 family)